MIWKKNFNNGDHIEDPRSKDLFVDNLRILDISESLTLIIAQSLIDRKITLEEIKVLRDFVTAVTMMVQEFRKPT